MEKVKDVTQVEKRIKDIAIILLCALCLVLANQVDELKFQLDIAPLKYKIQECLNSKEAVALEKYNKNVEDAINERRVQEAGVCED